MSYLDKLIGRIEEEKLTNLDLEKIKRAYYFAEKAHEWQNRKNREPYISHLVEVAIILLDLKPDTFTIVSAILHDIIDNTSVTEKDIEREFWYDVWKIVSWLTKVAKVELIWGERQVTALRKMFIAMASDLRVVLIKLADRLHNLKTISFSTKEKQRFIAKETLEIYAPISERLGIFKLKTPLEDISFSILEPDIYSKIETQVFKIKSDFISKVSKKISDVLQLWDFINFEISWRIKWKYSIYKKMTKKWVDDIYDLYDIFAIRIIVNSIEDCYRALWIIHKNWTPLSHRFKDYIATPKPNWYRSLHSVVIWIWKELEDDFRPVEIQIRTKEMHLEAEFWIASHWSYKEWIKLDTLSGFISNLVSLEKDIEDHSEFLNQIQVDALNKRIFVLTPQWDIKDLPEWATPIDFAFSIHGDLWLECVWTQVNNRSVSLFTPLKNWDTVKILTRKWAKPNPSWLPWVKTNQAKTAIKKWLNEQNLDSIFKDWKKMINDCLLKFWREKLDNNFSILKNYNWWKLSKKERVVLIENVWKGILLPIKAIEHIVVETRKTNFDDLYRGKDPELYSKKTSSKGDLMKADILIEWELNKNAKIVDNCCNPWPWDEIIWYVTRWTYIWVHKKFCPFISSADHSRFLKASWSTDPIEYTARAKVVFKKEDWILSWILKLLDIEWLNFDRIEYTNNLSPIEDVVEISVSFRDLNLFSIAVDEIKGFKWVIDFKMISLEQ